jgi:hypothetical protein
VSKKFIARCTGSYDIRADLKIKAMASAIDNIYHDHRRISVEDIHLSIASADSFDGFYTVEYSFIFSTFGESELDVEKIIKKGETLAILSVN